MYFELQISRWISLCAFIIDNKIIYLITHFEFTAPQFPAQCELHAANSQESINYVSVTKQIKR